MTPNLAPRRTFNITAECWGFAACYESQRRVTAELAAASAHAGKLALRWYADRTPEFYAGRHTINAMDAARRAWHLALSAERAADRLTEIAAKADAVVAQ